MPKKVSGSKVIATTLATGTVGGSLQTALEQAGKGQQLLQGVLLKVGKRMRDWKKIPTTLSGKGTDAKLSFEKEIGVYEEIVSKSPAEPPK